MATDRAEPPEGFTDAVPGGQHSGDVSFEIEPGDVLQGTVLSITSGENANGDWYRIRMKDDVRGVGGYFAEDEAKKAARNENIAEGDVVWIKKLEEMEEGTDESTGDEFEYYPVRCKKGAE